MFFFWSKKLQHAIATTTFATDTYLHKVWAVAFKRNWWQKCVEIINFHFSYCIFSEKYVGTTKYKYLFSDALYII